MVLGTALASLALFAASCGNDDEEKQRNVRAGDLQRYCRLLRELDRAGTEFTRRLEQEDPTESEVQAAKKEFVEQIEADLDEVERAAPESIRKDTETVNAAQRARAGLAPPVDEARAEAAFKRIRRFERRNCG